MPARKAADEEDPRGTAALEARLFPRAAPVHERVRPECAHIHRELKRDGVTLQLLWEEYAQVHPHGYRYTQFCGKRTPRSGWNGWVMRICGASAAPDPVWSSDEGCGRGSCTSGPALDTRPTPRRDVLQPRRPEPGDPRPPRRAQRPAVEEARRQPPRPLRAARPSGPPAPAGHALRPRAVEAVPPQHRLPRPRRATRLQRAVPAPPRAGRDPLHDDDRRGLLQGPPRVVAPAPL